MAEGKERTLQQCCEGQKWELWLFARTNLGFGDRWRAHGGGHRQTV